MGYKLAGFKVLGANDIDPDMQRAYVANHHPSIFIKSPIGDMLKGDLPPELFDLDVLDGSPPCSNFSLAGSQEEAWGVKKKFREGQASQVLDDLFFDLIALAKRLRPKVVVAENVKGMLLGNAKGYLVEIKRQFEAAGYEVQLFMLNSASMGVPQKRERVFFVCRRADLSLPPVSMSFDEQSVTLGTVMAESDSIGKPLSEAFARWWRLAPPGQSLSYGHPKGSFFNSRRLSRGHVCATITASSGAKLTHPDVPNEVSRDCLCLCGTFPLDYDFVGLDPKYLIGMSVPPVMMANVAWAVWDQILRGMKKSVY